MYSLNSLVVEYKCICCERFTANGMLAFLKVVWGDLPICLLAPQRFTCRSAASIRNCQLRYCFHNNYKVGGWCPESYFCFPIFCLLSLAIGIKQLQYFPSWKNMLRSQIEFFTSNDSSHSFLNKMTGCEITPLQCSLVSPLLKFQMCSTEHPLWLI